MGNSVLAARNNGKDQLRVAKDDAYSRTMASVWLAFLLLHVWVLVVAGGVSQQEGLLLFRNF